MILDTCLLVDLQRELRDGRDRGASRLLRAAGSAFPRICLVTWMEFAEGYAESNEAACRQFLGRFPVIVPDLTIAWQASRIARSQRAIGEPIGDHDTWIAATAIVHDLPVVTRNARRFEHVEGLTVRAYGIRQAPPR